MKTTQLDSVMTYVEHNGLHILHDTLPRPMTEAGMQILFVHGGAYYDKQPGTGHLLEHVKATAGNHPSTYEFSVELESKAAHRNAMTGNITWLAYIRGPKQYGSFLWQTLRELSIDTVLQPKLITQEQAIIEQEIVRENGSKSYQLQRLVNSKIYKPNSYQLTDILGEAEGVKNCTLDMLQDKDQQVHKDSNVVIMLHNIDTKTSDQVIADMVEWQEKIGNRPLKKIEEDDYSELQDFKILPIIDDRAHDGVKLRLIFPFSCTFENFAVRSILRKIALGGGTLSKLFHRLRNELGLIYDLSADFDIDTQTVMLGCTCALKHVETIIQEIHVFLENKKSLLEYEEDPKKFERLKEVIALKSMMADEENQWGRLDNALNDLRSWNRLRSYDDYIASVKAVDLSEIKEALRMIASSWKDIRVIGISSDKKLEGVLAQLRL